MAEFRAENAVAAGIGSQAGQNIASVTRLKAAGQLSGKQQRHQVGLSAAGSEDTVGKSLISHALAGPVDNLLFNQSPAGALIPGFHRGIDGRTQLLGQQGCEHYRAVEVGQIIRVLEVDGVAEIERVQFGQNLLHVPEGRSRLISENALCSSSGRMPLLGPSSRSRRCFRVSMPS